MGDRGTLKVAEHSKHPTKTKQKTAKKLSVAFTMWSLCWNFGTGTCTSLQLLQNSSTPYTLIVSCNFDLMHWSWINTSHLYNPSHSSMQNRHGVIEYCCFAENKRNNICLIYEKGQYLVRFPKSSTTTWIRDFYSSSNRLSSCNWKMSLESQLKVEIT